MTPTVQTEEFRIHCYECVGNGDFRVPRASVVHLDEAGRLAYYATCPEGHIHPVEPEQIIHAPEVRRRIEALVTEQRHAEQLHS